MNSNSTVVSIEKSIAFLMIIFVLMVVVVPETHAGTAFQDACGKVDTFFTSINSILKAISVTVVTIAIVFAGYQIAFAHKRFSDVAPVLIGGLLIGGAATIATWFTDGYSAAC